jgi:hypothetical protein
MLAGHLDPDRGWTVICTDELFTPEEDAHLESCPQCREWVAAFSEVARSSGPDLNPDTAFYVVADAHMSAERGWSLIRDRGFPEPYELAHLQFCRRCNEWMSTFTHSARTSGFVVSFEIPPYEIR